MGKHHIDRRVLQMQVEGVEFRVNQHVGETGANGVDRLKKDGAPIEWIAPEPVIGLTFGLAVVKGSPHPHAARLLVDYLLSREGQEIMGSAGYFAPRTDVNSPILKEAPPKTKVVPLPMTLAPRYNEYFQTYRKVMRLR